MSRTETLSMTTTRSNSPTADDYTVRQQKSDRLEYWYAVALCH